MMKELKIAVEDRTLEAYQDHAKQLGVSLDEVIRRVLERGTSSEGRDWLEECFQWMDQAGANSAGKRFCREDIYDV